MNRIHRLRGALGVAGLLAVALLTADAPAHAQPPKSEPVAFETLGIVADTTGINLDLGQILRISSNGAIAAAGDLLRTGYDSAMANEVMDAFDTVPSDRVVLIGVIDVGCTPADVAGLARLDSGELTIFAPDHVPEQIECYVANTTVAVLSVAATDAPLGSVDGADLIAFEDVIGTSSNGPSAADLSGLDPATGEEAIAGLLADPADVPALPPLADDDRRFAFVVSGCALAGAELRITRARISVSAEQEDPQVELLCDAFTQYVAVFDVPAGIVPPNAVLDGAAA